MFGQSLKTLGVSIANYKRRSEIAPSKEKQKNIEITTHHELDQLTHHHKTHSNIKPKTSSQLNQFNFPKNHTTASPPQGLAAAAATIVNSMSKPPLNHPISSLQSTSLYKQKTWSPDSYREEAWLRQKDRRLRRSRSVTDEDVDEIKACLELGFSFDSPVMDKRLSDTFPAYGLYYSVNKSYNDTVVKPPVLPLRSPPPSECGSPSPVGSPLTIFGPDDTPQTVKTRLRQWAQVVACAVRQSPC